MYNYNACRTSMLKIAFSFTWKVCGIFPNKKSLRKKCHDCKLFDSNFAATQSRSSFTQLRKSAKYQWHLMINLGNSEVMGR